MARMSRRKDCGFTEPSCCSIPHDGFTLQDLVSYNGKHNEANGEENRDGTDNNRSSNCGAEGPTDDPEINRLWAQQKNGTSWPRSFFRKAFPYCWPATQPATPALATIMPIARTMRSVGSTGTRHILTTNSWPLYKALPLCARIIQYSGAETSSKAEK